MNLKDALASLRETLSDPFDTPNLHTYEVNGRAPSQYRQGQYDIILWLEARAREGDKK